MITALYAACRLISDETYDPAPSHTPCPTPCPIPSPITCHTLPCLAQPEEFKQFFVNAYERGDSDAAVKDSEARIAEVYDLFVGAKVMRR